MEPNQHILYQTLEQLQILKAELKTESEQKENFLLRAEAENSWFTQPEIVRMIDTICEKYLDQQKLEFWLSNYHLNYSITKTIGIIAAGNIPLISFHDLLCTWVSPHKAELKLSSKDKQLYYWIKTILEKHCPLLNQKTKFVERLNSFDAVIATGSDLASNQFRHYFEKVPHIIRAHRNSVAVLTKNCPSKEWHQLGDDIFNYFGLGCRNVSKIFIPEQFPLEELISSLDIDFAHLAHHPKYANNYDYQLALCIMGKEEFFQGKTIIAKQSKLLNSPVSVLHYEFYEDFSNLMLALERKKDNLQCIVSDIDPMHADLFAFGSAQRPELWDYSDGVDTLKFLAEL
ncbi:MAG: acyl-CoA reductase [Saprospiraceae bacterium]|nr:acyl-CoA reductase [Saprospiraceae bacterium]